MKNKRLEIRQVNVKSFEITVSLVGDCGHINIEDTGLYPDEDSRTTRRDLGFNSMLVPLMTREDLKRLRTAIDEVLKNSK